MATFPAAPLPTVTELLINGTWTDISRRVRDTDDDPGVQITRGRSNESQRVQPARLNLTLDNRDGALSNRLPIATYYGLLGRNTQLRHRLRWTRCTFTGTASNSWPACDTGETWTNSGGVAADFQGTGTAGTHRIGSLAVKRRSVVSQARAFDVQVTLSFSAVATGGPLTTWLNIEQDANNFYSLRPVWLTGGTIRLDLLKWVGGVESFIVDTGSSPVLSSYAPGTQWTFRLQWRPGGRLRGAAWLTSSNPTSTTWLTSGTDTSFDGTDFTGYALESRAEGGNTNVNPTASYDDFEANSYRFWGEVPSWPLTWDTTGADVTAPIEAAGIMRRLGTSAKPLRSALFRTMAGVAPGDYVPYLYWPMEDGSDATQFASGLANGTPLSLPTGTTPGAIAGPAGSESLATLAAGATLPFAVPSYVGTQIAFQWFMRIPSEPAAEMTLAEFYASSGPVRRWKVSIVPGSPAALWLRDYDATGTEINATGVSLAGASATNPSEADVFGNWVAILFAPQQIGGNVHSWLGIAAGPPGGAPGIGNVDAGTLGTVTGGVLFGGESGCGIGHMGVYTDPAFDLGFTGVAPKANVAAMNGYDGETAADRMTRLCHELAIPFELIGNASDTKAMGPQRSGKLLDLLFECADVDQGILFEPRDALGLAYRTSASLINQTGLALDYDASQIFAPFQPTEDDQIIVNDATARRTNGSFSRVTVDSGPLSTQDPPNGVGTYDEDRTYNVAADDQLADLAGWRTHIGSWDEARFPQVHVMLHAPAYSGSASLTGQAAAVDVGDYLSVAHPPAWLPPDLIELLAQGYRETHRNYGWDITWNCTPAGPYKVGVYDDARYDSDYTTTAEALDTTETGVDITVTSGQTGWVTTASNPAEFPFDIVIGGERMTVTASVSTGANTYTLTVTRSVNGIVKSHSTGAAVHVQNPGYYGL